MKLVHVSFNPSEAGTPERPLMRTPVNASQPDLSRTRSGLEETVGPKDHLNTRILHMNRRIVQMIIYGFPLFLGLKTTMLDPCSCVVFCPRKTGKVCFAGSRLTLEVWAASVSFANFKSAGLGQKLPHKKAAIIVAEGCDRLLRGFLEEYTRQ